MLQFGDYTYVIANDKSLDLQAFQFGFTPSGADKKKYYYNARSEGDFNKENDPKIIQENLGLKVKKLSEPPSVQKDAWSLPMVI